MESLLVQERFDLISPADKAFITAFDGEIAKLGYDCGGAIGSGYCWGKYMIIYAKTGVKSRQVAARIYIREDGIVLRLFLNQIDKHRPAVEAAPAFIKEAFAGEHGTCHHCHNDKGGVCKFRKTYTLDGRYFEKCNGFTFEFHNPNLERLPAYLSLLEEFYPNKRGRRTAAR